MAQAAGHRVQVRREAGGHPGGIVAQRKVLVAEHLESALIEQRIQIGLSEVDQMARHIDSVPALAQHQELPAGRVGDLDDEPPIGLEQMVRGVQITARIVEMFEHVKHGDGGAAGGGNGGSRERCTEGRHAGAAPRHVGRLKRKIEADDGHPCAAFGTRPGARAGTHPGALPQHLEEQSAAAPDVQDQTFFFRLPDGALDEAEVIAQHEAAVGLLQPARRGGFRDEPIIRRIVVPQLQRRRLRVQTDKAAVAALDDLENFAGGAIETVGGGEQDARGFVAAGGAEVDGFLHTAC